MFTIVKIVESLILPPGLFAVIMAILGYFAYRKLRRISIALFLVAAIVYASSTQMVAGALIRPLEDAYPQPRHPHGDVIVMLGGGSVIGTPDINGEGNLSGSAANRLLTTARLYDMLHLPIIITAGPKRMVQGQDQSEAQIAKRELISLGIPSGLIYTENNSRNTEENAEFTKPILKAHHLRHPILVTSAFHMSRAVLDFEHYGIEVTPFPTDYQASTISGSYQLAYLPSTAALDVTELALKEYVGWVATKLGVKG
ncbi:YdcF family protein [Alicyclobacillus acidoterrestris]|uniref:YdcF family protein n=1 Tax=Alicyclobacillus acidoterrestris (strain ATCC 49025 / DSM 3922 / CIP 106132 / NCIMB 13137 / GD3B) TaxID=1356854 RepID=T0BMA3_ALIAG|nr:YdcF family protein [Alicyclobacillus acidoterrestris]EPZ45123.1 hypothetical protein N007_09950 [Alicyclobacillus acidoterrestris ATCC 49025]UNO48409.1 YdcF family protein [Alicyclobacillus acidoterrestris]